MLEHVWNYDKELPTDFTEISLWCLKTYLHVIPKCTILINAAKKCMYKALTMFIFKIVSTSYVTLSQYISAGHFSKQPSCYNGSILPVNFRPLPSLWRAHIDLCRQGSHSRKGAIRSFPAVPYCVCSTGSKLRWGKDRGQRLFRTSQKKDLRTIPSSIWIK